MPVRFNERHMSLSLRLPVNRDTVTFRNDATEIDTLCLALTERPVRQAICRIPMPVSHTNRSIWLAHGKIREIPIRDIRHKSKRFDIDQQEYIES
jgi:hypothetical protein